ncbi:hypothetical protein PLICRDRAFT_36240 [Plicaturopsis crispa FD-325 SS-3]|nr:hypothetical protein PLICRDRAFT_36240 [Plicaturopsis crispa FD-325 SS-3]
MSRIQRLFPFAVAGVTGIISGVYIFKPIVLGEDINNTTGRTEPSLNTSVSTQASEVVSATGSGARPDANAKP